MGSSHSDYTAKKTGVDPMAAHGGNTDCSAAANNCGKLTFAATNCYAVRYAGFLKGAGAQMTATADGSGNGGFYEVFAKFASATNAGPAGKANIFTAGVATTQMFARVELSGSPFDLTVTS